MKNIAEIIIIAMALILATISVVLKCTYVRRCCMKPKDSDGSYLYTGKSCFRWGVVLIVVLWIIGSEFALKYFTKVCFFYLIVLSIQFLYSLFYLLPIAPKIDKKILNNNIDKAGSLMKGAMLSILLILTIYWLLT